MKRLNGNGSSAADWLESSATPQVRPEQPRRTLRIVMREPARHGGRVRRSARRREQRSLLPTAPFRDVLTRTHLLLRSVLWSSARHELQRLRRRPEVAVAVAEAAPWQLRAPRQSTRRQCAARCRPGRRCRPRRRAAWSAPPACRLLESRRRRRARRLHGRSVLGLRPAHCAPRRAPQQQPRGRCLRGRRSRRGRCRLQPSRRAEVSRLRLRAPQARSRRRAPAAPASPRRRRAAAWPRRRPRGLAQRAQRAAQRHYQEPKRRHRAPDLHHPPLAPPWHLRRAQQRPRRLRLLILRRWRRRRSERTQQMSRDAPPRRDRHRQRRCLRFRRWQRHLRAVHRSAGHPE